MPRGLLAAARRAAQLGEFGPFFVGGAGLPGAWSHSPDTLPVSLVSAGRAPMTMIRSTHIRLLVPFAMVALGVVLAAGQQPQAPAGGRGAAAPAGSGAAPQGRGADGASLSPARASRSTARSRTTCRSPTRCSAIPIPATG